MNRQNSCIMYFGDKMRTVRSIRTSPVLHQFNIFRSYYYRMFLPRTRQWSPINGFMQYVIYIYVHIEQVYTVHPLSTFRILWEPRQRLLDTFFLRMQNKYLCGTYALVRRAVLHTYSCRVRSCLRMATYVWPLLFLRLPRSKFLRTRARWTHNITLYIR